MELPFTYACTCEESKQLVVSNIHERGHLVRLEQCMDEIVDRSWDESDAEMISMMTFVLHRLKKSEDFNDDCTAASTDTDELLPQNETDLAILKTIPSLTSSGSPCVCREISHRLSIVLEAGLAELNVEPIQENSLLEKVQLLRPYVQHYQTDASMVNFLTRSWKQAVRFYFPRLIDELAQVYPQFLNALIDELMKSVEAGTELMLESSKVFKFLSRCLTVQGSFYAILSYLSELDHSLSQPLVSACIEYTKKEQLSSQQYFDLFPMRLRPYAVIMNEIMNPADPDVEFLFSQLKKEHPKDYKMLIMISPVFCCLDKY